MKFPLKEYLTLNNNIPYLRLINKSSSYFKLISKWDANYSLFWSYRRGWGMAALINYLRYDIIE